MSEPQTFEHTFDLPVPPSRAFAAWTEPAQLEAWLADEVEIDPREGGDFRFWGRSVLGTPGANQADQRVTAFEQGAKLSFSWTLCGLPSQVELTFAAAVYVPFAMGSDAPKVEPVPGCKLTLRHRLEGTLPFPRPEQLLDDHWRLACGNLFGHLEGKGNVVLPDYVDDTAEARLSIEIEAPPSAVFRALIEPDQLERWMASKATIDPRPGGVFDLGWSEEHGAPTCKILELETDRKLAISWPDWRNDPEVPDQRVEWLLTPLSGGAVTRVEILHTGFVRAADRSDFQQGWTGFAEALDRVARSIPAAG